MDHFFELADFILVRSPLLPFAQYFSNNAIHPAETRDAEIRARRAKDRLRDIISLPEVQDALYIGSPSLCQRAIDWTPEQKSEKALKLQRSIYKYVSRMVYRCTPFGLFAGVSWSPVSFDPSIKTPYVALDSRENYFRRCRIDMSVLSRILHSYVSDKDINRYLKYDTNPTLHRFGDKWHYLEPVILNGVAQRFQMAEVESSIVLDAIVSALNGSDTSLEFNQLLGIIENIATDTIEEERQEFLVSLIGAHILLTNLEPAITQEDPFLETARNLEAAGLDVPPAWAELVPLLTSINAAKLGRGKAITGEIESKIQQLAGNDQVKNLLQTDLFKPIKRAALPLELIEDLLPAAKVLALLQPKTSPPLDNFASAFRHRYGDRVVPLLEALDCENGVGFGSAAADDLPLLRNIPLEQNREGHKAGQNSANAVTELLIKEFERACRENLEEIDINEKIGQLFGERLDVSLPVSFFLLVTMVSKAGDQDSTIRPWIRSAGGPSGANLIGRFCWGDSNLTDATKNYLKIEEQNIGSDTVVTEIIHRPVSRIENVLIRPSLRSRETPIFGRSQLPREQQCDLKDMMLSVSRNRRIHLTCAKTGKRILPRLTSAHNFRRNAVPVYEFLAALQSQEGTITAFSWLPFLRSVDRLPRVVYKNCILIPQQWNLSSDRLRLLRKIAADSKEKIIAKWRDELAWPQFIELVDGDNCLIIDLNDPVGVDCLIEELKDRNAATIQEAAVPTGKTLVEGPEGVFCHEFLLPFVAQSPISSHRNVSLKTNNPEQRADFHIGSQWLYLRLSCGTSTLDRILNEYFRPLIDALEEKRIIDKWFFLRYADPGHHLRIRFHGDPAILWGEGLAEIQKVITALVDQKLVWGVEAASYEPEVDRYGGPNAIQIAESVFHVDSIFALSSIANPDFMQPDLRWSLTALSVDRLWSDFGFDEHERFNIYGRISDQMRTSFASSRTVKVAIDHHFRRVRSHLSELLVSPNISLYTEFQDSVDARSNQLRPLIASLLDLNESITCNVEDIVKSYAHMSVNRLCVSMNTAQEMIIYELLYRFFRSELAKNSRLQKDMACEVG